MSEVTSQELAKVPAPLKEAVASGVLETKSQADWGRKKIVRWVVGVFGTGAVGIVWTALVGASKVSTTLTNTVNTSKADHTTLDDHSIKIQQLVDGEREISSRQDRLEKLVGDNQTAVLGAIRDGGVQTQRTLDHLLSSVGELKGQTRIEQGNQPNQ